MRARTPNRTETEKFCEAVSQGRPVRFRRKTRLQADIIRRLILGLPVGGKCYRLNPAGISVENAIIKGRLDLDSVCGSGGGPICALAFVRCRFEGGFSGANGHFRHLRFSGSTFVDVGNVGENTRPRPSIDLRSATIESTLIMDRLRPDRSSQQLNHLWIRAPNLVLNGSLKLDRTHLLAPDGPEVEFDDWKYDAITLTLARIGGDLSFLCGGHSKGRFNLRSAQVEGDVWMSGATLENPDGEALFAQGAHIHGLLMLEGAPPAPGAPDRARPLRVKGSLMLPWAQVGKSLNIAPSSSPDWAADKVDLSLARIGEDLRIVAAAGDGWVGPIAMIRTVVQGTLRIEGVYTTPPREREGTVWNLSGVRTKSLELVSCGSGPLRDSSGAGTGRGPKDWSKQFLDLVLYAVSVEAQCVEMTEIRLRGPLLLDSLRCETDVTIGGRIELLRLRDATIGTSLNLEKLNLVDAWEGAAPGPQDRPADLDLFDARIGRAIKLVPDSASPESAVRPPRLLAARYKYVGSLPGTQLIETLWLEEQRNGAPAYSVFEMGLLYKDYKPTILDGNSAVLHRFVANQPFLIRNADLAEEYLRIFCRYVQGDDGAFCFVGRKPDGSALLPAFACVDRKRLQRDRQAFAKTVRRYLDGAIRFAMLEKAKRKMERLAAMLKMRVPAVVTQQKGSSPSFKTIAPILYGTALFEAEFEMRPAAERAVNVTMLRDRQISPELTCVPRFEGARVRHPKEQQYSRQWVTPPTLPGMLPLPEARRRFFEFVLRPLLYQPIHSNACVDLRDCECDTLQDGSGRGWGDPREIRMDHFQYSKTLHSRPREEEDGETKEAGARNPTLALLAGFLASIRRKVLPRSLRRGRPRRRQAPLLPFATRLRFAVLRRLPLVPEDLCRNLIQHEEATSAGWRARRNWIFRQFPDRYRFPSIDRYRILESREYRPQPLEQAIKVARLEGRRSDAVEFAILKRKLEWNIFSKQWRGAFGLAGAVLGFLTGLFAIGDLGGMASGVIIGFGVGFLVSGFFDRLLRWGFGYMLKSLNAAVTLVLVFLIGWWGVNAANANRMLIIDLAPVATVAGRESTAAGSAAVLGIPVSTVPPATRLACGRAISEAIYALDVLIPLVDLHEEEKCEIGRAWDAPRPPAIARDAPVGVRLMAWVEARSLHSPDFLATMKAIYALLGWVAISLGILTFANVARSGMENN